MTNLTSRRERAHSQQPMRRPPRFCNVRLDSATYGRVPVQCGCAP